MWASMHAALAQSGPALDVSAFIGEVLKFGLGGAWILFLIWLLRQRDKSYNELNVRHQALVERYMKDMQDCSEKRIAQGIESTKLLGQTVETIGRFGEVSEKQIGTLETVVSSLAKLDGALSDERRGRR